jgi:hypothetical protein
MYGSCLHFCFCFHWFTTDCALSADVLKKIRKSAQNALQKPESELRAEINCNELLF